MRKIDPTHSISYPHCRFLNLVLEPQYIPQVRCVAGMESGIELCIPPNDVADPELSIVIPALNEERNIAEFVSWCKEGLRRANIRGEIILWTVPRTTRRNWLSWAARGF